ncbi:MAG TPA: PilZ domain-containing protein [Polyangiales bacterium]|nr:PilZ domain-containing protein [Polyangiales bacterium]
MPNDAPSNAPTRRRHPRSASYVTVRWHNRAEEGVAAVVYDVSAEGLFLVPEGPLPETVRAGDPVWVVVPTQQREETLTGVVRWTGYHPAHHVIGCGIRVEGPSLELIRRVFPSVQTQ